MNCDSSGGNPSPVSITYLAFDSVICEDIEQLVEDFKPRQVAEETKQQKKWFLSLYTDMSQFVVNLQSAGVW